MTRASDKPMLSCECHSTPPVPTFAGLSGLPSGTMSTTLSRALTRKKLTMLMHHFTRRFYVELHDYTGPRSGARKDDYADALWKVLQHLKNKGISDYKLLVPPGACERCIEQNAQRSALAQAVPCPMVATDAASIAAAMSAPSSIGANEASSLPPAGPGVAMPPNAPRVFAVFAPSTLSIIRLQTQVRFPGMASAAGGAAPTFNVFTTANAMAAGSPLVSLPMAPAPSAAVPTPPSSGTCTLVSPSGARPPPPATPEPPHQLKSHTAAALMRQANDLRASRRGEKRD